MSANEDERFDGYLNKAVCDALDRLVWAALDPGDPSDYLYEQWRDDQYDKEVNDDET